MIKVDDGINTMVDEQHTYRMNITQTFTAWDILRDYIFQYFTLIIESNQSNLTTIRFDEEIFITPKYLRSIVFENVVISNQILMSKNLHSFSYLTMRIYIFTSGFIQSKYLRKIKICQQCTQTIEYIKNPKYLNYMFLQFGSWPGPFIVLSKNLRTCVIHYMIDFGILLPKNLVRLSYKYLPSHIILPLRLKKMEIAHLAQHEIIMLSNYKVKTNQVIPEYLETFITVNPECKIIENLSCYLKYLRVLDSKHFATDVFYSLPNCLKHIEVVGDYYEKYRFKLKKYNSQKQYWSPHRNITIYTKSKVN